MRQAGRQATWYIVKLCTVAATTEEPFLGFKNSLKVSGFMPWPRDKSTSSKELRVPETLKPILRRIMRSWIGSPALNIVMKVDLGITWAVDENLRKLSLMGVWTAGPLWGRWAGSSSGSFNAWIRSARYTVESEETRSAKKWARDEYWNCSSSWTNKRLILMKKLKCGKQ